MLAALIAHCARHPTARILLLAHRDQLIRQLGGALTAWGVPHARLQARDKTPGPDVRVVVAMVQTATRRRLPPFDLVVVDETHHAISASFMRLFELSPRALVCGVTATPMRLDGTGLGRPNSVANSRRKGVFDELIIGPSMAELTEAGWLSPLKCYAPDGDARKRFKGVKVHAGDYAMEQAAQVQLSDPVKRYRELICEGGPPKPALSFDCTVASAEETAATFRAAGYRAAALHGGTPDAQRTQWLAELSCGELHVLSSCEVLGEGVDVVSVAGALLRRPTKSLTVHMQQIGRCTRIAPGKTHAVVVDFVGRFFTHGDPYSPIAWDLDGRKPREAEEADRTPLRDCPGCGVLVPLGTRECRYCGHLFEVAVQEVELVEDVRLLVDFGRKLFEVPSAAVERVRQHLGGNLPADWPRGGRALLQWCQVADALLAGDSKMAHKLCRDFAYKTGFVWFVRNSLGNTRHDPRRTTNHP